VIFNQFGRKLTLILFSTNGKAMDLSPFRVTFNVANADFETPNNASIRIYGLSRDTINSLITKDEYQFVSLSAGYVDGAFGVIFAGEIKQYKHGKDDTTSMYLDILAADGDIAYNQTTLNESIAAGQETPQSAIQAIADKMNLNTVYGLPLSTGIYNPNIRGKVRFGMAKKYLRNVTRSIDFGWSIQQGKLNIVHNNGYLDNEVVDINYASGLIGSPEQTDEGIAITCLLNPKLRIGGLVRLNNELITNTVFSKAPGAPSPYNQYKGYQYLAPLAPDDIYGDGIYRIFVVEYEGDTRGNNWYSNLVGLSMDSVKKSVIQYPNSQNSTTSETIAPEL